MKPRKERKSCPICSKVVENLQSRFCGIKCHWEDRYLRFLEEWKSGVQTGTTCPSDLRVSGFIRRYLFEKNQNRCSLCGWGEKNPTTGKIPLTVEHRNGDASDSREENLTLLCPNCHSLTPTYGNLNRGRGREERRKTEAKKRVAGIEPATF